MNRWLRRIAKLFNLVEFALFYVKEVILSNLRVAYDVITPKYYMQPAFIELDLQGMSHRQILILANLITMTPGTLSLDICEQTQTLKIHSMYVENPQTAVRNLETTILRRIRNVF